MMVTIVGLNYHEKPNGRKVFTIYIDQSLILIKTIFLQSLGFSYNLEFTFY